MSLIYRDLKIYLYWGEKGSGKSLVNAYIAKQLLDSYKIQEQRYPTLPKRKYYSKTPLSKEIEERELGKHLEYWDKPLQLYNVRNADISWDEIQNDLPTGGWKDTHPKTKQLFSHLRKRGNRLFANAQIYEDIDIAFRRQVDRAFHVKKFFGSADISASLPPPKFVWGLIRLREYNPRDLEVDKKEREPKALGAMRFVWIRKSLINIYDTTKELDPFMPNTLEHREFKCMDCGKIHIEHYKL